MSAESFGYTLCASCHGSTHADDLDLFEGICRWCAQTVADATGGEEAEMPRKSTTETKAVPAPKSPAKGPDWHSLEGGDLVAHLESHLTLSDAAWAFARSGEIRAKGEGRSAFIRRSILGE